MKAKVLVIVSILLASITISVSTVELDVEGFALLYNSQESNPQGSRFQDVLFQNLKPQNKISDIASQIKNVGG